MGDGCVDGDDHMGVMCCARGCIPRGGLGMVPQSVS